MTQKNTKDLSFIDEAVINTVPDAFKELDGEADYTLVKTGSKRQNWAVQEGDRVTGSLRIVNVCEQYGPGVCVSRGFKDYIRTSPIVRVDKTLSDDTGLVEIQFETEGGFYTLRKRVEQ